MYIGLNAKYKFFKKFKNYFIYFQDILPEEIFQKSGY